MPAYIEMLTRSGSFAICIVSITSGNILVFDDGYAYEELPHFCKPFNGKAKFYQCV